MATVNVTITIVTVVDVLIELRKLDLQCRLVQTVREKKGERKVSLEVNTHKLETSIHSVTVVHGHLWDRRKCPYL
jgi:hypothetical protein